MLDKNIPEEMNIQQETIKKVHEDAIKNKMDLFIENTITKLLENNQDLTLTKYLEICNNKL